MREVPGGREDGGYLAHNFVDQVRRIFIEECVSYTVDGLGDVHLRVDEQFELLRYPRRLELQPPRQIAQQTLGPRGVVQLPGLPERPADGGVTLRVDRSVMVRAL
jgi:hypothetical protein